MCRYCAAAGVAPPPAGDWAFYLALSLFRLLAILAGVQVGASEGVFRCDVFLGGEVYVHGRFKEKVVLRGLEKENLFITAGGWVCEGR